jgi:hypothetical protein
MNIVEFNKEKHYATMERLWQECQWKPCPIEALPGIGLVAETNDNKFIAYIGMYAEPGKIGFIDWALTDKTHGIICGKALCKLVDNLIERAKTFKCHFIYSATKTEAWKKILISRGLTVAEQGADTFVMSLNNQDTSFIGDY